MGKKVLFVATTAKGHLNVFHIPYIKMLKERGWQVDAASNGDEIVPYVDKDYCLSIERSPFKVGNLKAIKQLCSIMRQRKYDLVICHTPMGGVVARLAARITGIGKVIYMAHGFHFYKGAPKKNWLVYYPVEWICAHFTDVLITINQEDYALARKRMKAKKVVYVPGVGIDLEKSATGNLDKNMKREELGIPKDVMIFLSVGELNENKNHQLVIKTLSGAKNLKIQYLIAGRGDKEKDLKALVAELGLQKHVKFLGYRNDIMELCKAADLFVFPSYREGLSLALMEAMAAGLPCAVSRIRGNTDLIDQNGGVLFDPYSVKDCRKALKTLMKQDMQSLGKYNRERVKEFELGNIMKIMESIYEEAVNE